MIGQALDAKAVLAVIVVVADFVIIGLYIALNRMPDGYVIALVSGSLSGITSFYFGHANGTTSALATTALDSLTRARALVSQQFPPSDVSTTP